MTEDTTCDYSIGQPRCGRSGFREVWKKSKESAWYVLCYRHFILEKKLGHLFAWGMIEPVIDSEVVRKRPKARGSSVGIIASQRKRRTVDSISNIIGAVRSRDRNDALEDLKMLDRS